MTWWLVIDDPGLNDYHALEVGGRLASCSALRINNISSSVSVAAVYTFNMGDPWDEWRRKREEKGARFKLLPDLPVLRPS